MMGMTPLMVAAEVGHVSLVQTLVERGARLDSVDTLGRMPVHFALRHAFREVSFARDKIGALYELLCPTAIEIELDGRRLRLGRNQGEFFSLLCFVARFHDLYGTAHRSSDFTGPLVGEQALAAFPRTILPEHRHKRAYWNAVLARAEVDSSYRPARRLWRRKRLGHYFPSSVGVRVPGESGSHDEFVPLDQLLATHHLDPEGHLPAG
jgi:hypothetical protein